MRNTKAYLGLLILCASSQCAYAESKVANRTSQPASAPQFYLTGDYFSSNGFGSSTLKLFSNGRFKESTFTDVMDPDGGASGYRTYGYYGVRDGFLILSPKYTTPKQGAKSRPANERTQWTGSSTRLVPVRWGKRIYLLYPGQQEAFCNAVNIGDEQRTAGDRPNWSWWFLRIGDEKKAVTGLPDVAEPWKSHLLPAPVTGKIIRVGKSSTAIVNVGKANKIKLGMIFTDNKGENENTFKVIALQNHQAVIDNETSQRADIKVGEEVSTRRTPIASG